MRNLQLLVILIVILFAISFIQKENLGNKDNQKKNIMTPMPTPTQIPTSSPIPTQTPNPTLLSPTLTSASSSQKNIRSFIYPGSTILNQSGDEITLQSTDDPQAITNWYKEKITSMGMNTKSFVQTNTNGNVLNKLAGSDGEHKVEIKISKKNNESAVEISVSIN